jgi:hypothetical protein
MRRAAEDRAGAVFHQHEIGDVNRHAAVWIERMDGFEPGIVAALLGCLDDCFAGAEPIALGDEFVDCRIARGELLGHRMMWRQRQKRGAEQCVGARREDFDRLVLAADVKEDARAFGAADPLLLHQADALGPAVERLQR